MLFKNDRIGFVVLNVFRAMNIISLFAALVASGALLVKTANLTGQIGWYNFFDLVEKAFIILFSLFLIITEMPKILDNYIDSHWPAFGHDAGFIVSSLCMMFLGCDVLSYLAKAETDQKHLGGDFFRMVQAAGFMCLVISVVNVPAGLLFSSKGLSVRRFRSSRRETYPVGLEMGSV